MPGRDDIGHYRSLFGLAALGLNGHTRSPCSRKKRSVSLALSPREYGPSAQPGTRSRGRHIQGGLDAPLVGQSSK